MEGLQKAIGNLSKNPNLGANPSSSSSDNPLSGESLSTSFSSSDQSRVLINRPPRQLVSLSTCSKLCAICFAVGVVVGFTLKRRVRHWASRLLKRLKDD